MYTALLSFKPSTVKVALLFLLDVRCQKCPHSFFCGCLSPTIVHLCNLFLLSTPVAQMVLTLRWVSIQKHVTQLFIAGAGNHSMNRRPTFSPYPHLVEEATYSPLYLNMVQIELHSHMPLQGPKFCAPLDSSCCSFVAYCYDLRNR